jgi:STE24 endopeptidase
MNGYGIVILVALLLCQGVRLLSGALDLRAFAPEPPAEFGGVYDAARCRRAHAYAAARTRFEMITSTSELAAILAFWLSGGFGWLDRSVRGLGAGPVVTGLLFIGVLALARALLGMPFAAWFTFVLEGRFGFNRTTPATFAADRLKGLVLAVVLGGPLLAAVLWLFTAAGNAAWLWAWALGGAALLALQFVAPAWIIPLFSRFTPLPPGPLRDSILAYGRAVGFPLAEIQVVDGSRRSTKANAYFTGFGRHRRIALFDTLLARLDPRGVVAVVAHEVGHWKLGHVLQGIAVAILHLGAVLLLLRMILEQPALFAAFGVAQPSAHVGIVLFGIVLAPVELLLAILLHAWSRRRERAADRFAVATTGDGPALARALAHLAADSLANPTPHPLTVWLEYSHPPVLERVRTLDPAAGRGAGEAAPA